MAKQTSSERIVFERLDLGAKQWWSTGSDGKRHSITDPMAQAQSSARHLVELARVDSILGHGGKGFPLPIGGAVILPHVRWKNELPLHWPSELVIDGGDIDEIAAAIDAAFAYWATRFPAKKALHPAQWRHLNWKLSPKGTKARQVRPGKRSSATTPMTSGLATFSSSMTPGSDPFFAFFVVKHGSREVVHFNVTRSPSEEWTTQQLREATPWGEGPRFLIRDNDSKFGSKLDAVAEGTGIVMVRIPPRSPNSNPICERFLGSVRRECLDHALIFNEDHLRRVLGEYVHAYFNVARPHQGLGQQIPRCVGSPPRTPDPSGEVVATAVFGGLHHDYRRAA